MIKWLKDKYLNWKVDRLLTSDFESHTVYNNFNEFDSSITTSIASYQSEKEYKYQQALAVIKRKIKDEAKTTSLDKVLKKYGNKKLIDDFKKDLYNKDLISVTEDFDPVKFFLKKLNIKTERDIKSKKDKKEMIQKRIKDYEILRQKNEIRSINKMLRAASRTKDEKLIKELEEKLNEKLRELKGKE